MASEELVARRLTVGAFLMPAVYILWMLPMIGLGWLITSWVGAYPSVDPGPELTAVPWGWLIAPLYGLVAGWPSWLGVWLAVRARRHGAGAWAWVALGINLVIGLVLVVSAVLPST